jgi:hypothetical protein
LPADAGLTSEPRNGAPPKLNSPPSLDTVQYPVPGRWAEMLTIGALSADPPIEPRNVASPKVKMPPSEATSQ